MISYYELQQLKMEGLALSQTDGLVDIKTVTINNSVDKVKRIEKYIEDVKNPYLFKVGDIVVQVQYGKNNAILQELVEKIVMNNNLSW